MDKLIDEYEVKEESAGPIGDIGYGGVRGGVKLLQICQNLGTCKPAEREVWVELWAGAFKKIAVICALVTENGKKLRKHGKSF